MKDYFPTSESSSARIQQPFIAEMNDNEQLNLHEQDLELQSSQAAKTKFSFFSLIEFWSSMLQEYPQSGSINSITFHSNINSILTTYICEAARSALVNIKTTYRNRLRVANAMRIAFSDINSVLMSVF